MRKGRLCYVTQYVPLVQRGRKGDCLLLCWGGWIVLYKIPLALRAFRDTLRNMSPLCKGGERGIVCYSVVGGWIVLYKIPLALRAFPLNLRGTRGDSVKRYNRKELSFRAKSRNLLF